MSQVKFSKNDETFYSSLINLLKNYTAEEQREIIGYARGVGDRSRINEALCVTTNDNLQPTG